MSVTKTTKTASKSRPSPGRNLYVESQGGLALFWCVLLLLSCLAGVKFVSGPPQYKEGEIAESDVEAREDFLVEDVEATQAKRRQAAQAEPPVFDLSSQAYEDLHKGVHTVFATIMAATPESLEDVRWQVAEDLNSEISKSTLNLWRREDFQNMVLARVLPWLRDYMANGVAKDVAELVGYTQGVVVRDVQMGTESLNRDPGAVADVRQMRADLAAYLKADLHKPLVMRKAVWSLVGQLVSPSLTLNTRETRFRIEQSVGGVGPVFFHVRRGEVVVRQGEAVTARQRLKLLAMAEQIPQSFTVHRAVGIFMLCGLFALGLFLVRRTGLYRALEPKDYVLLSVILLVFGGLAKFLALSAGSLSAGAMHDVIPYSLPLPGAAGVMALFFPVPVCMFALVCLSFVCTEMMGGGLPLFIFFFIGGVVQLFTIKRAETRSELLASVLPLLGCLVMAWVGVNIMDYQGMQRALAGGAYVLAGGAVSLILVLSLSPIVELVLGYTSRFRLMELMSLEQPLMRELMVGAPGTYHHSIVVAGMVEAGARAIGANPLLAKVAALYHDVGKLSKPQYFIENQMGGENRHDKLSPSMSALILTSHVKQGVEMARTHKLGRRIEDIIQQHHGTSLISFFHHKAVEQALARGEEPPREEAFCYPGPKPQTKEAGLLLLADAIEASSRALVEPTPSRIKGHIEKTVKRIFLEGQLDESALTLKDLHQISSVFERILAGIFHQRIRYPEDKAAAAEAREDGENRKDGKGRKNGKAVENGDGGGTVLAFDAKRSAK
ncbi:HD family phosphohydrolase [Desulfocurvus sp. DL9XJH121]